MPTAEPTAPPIQDIPFLPEYQSVSFKDGTYPVYTGPGETYFRVGNATLGGGVCRLYGSIGDWLLIGYGTSDGGYRIGFITNTALPETITTSELLLSSAHVTLQSEASITDDPVINAVAFGKLPAGSQVTVLAYLNDANNWAYVEVTDFQDGRPARGFINRNHFE